MDMSAIAKTLFASLAGVCLATAAHASPIVVGGKDFTEQRLLAEMNAQLLEANGFEVEKRDGMASQALRDAQVEGQVDVYWEYTGTSLTVFNASNSLMDATDTYEAVKALDAKIGLVWLEPSSANNTYALAVKGSDEKTASLQSLSDLAKAYNDGQSLVMALDTDFPTRPDGLPNLEKTYAFKTTDAGRKTMAPGQTHEALKNGEADVALVFATDGQIEAYDFRVLKDDKGSFGPYTLAPVVRADTLQAHPELADLLNALSAQLSDEVLQRLNAQVDIENKPVETVAGEFLRATGLI